MTPYPFIFEPNLHPTRWGLERWLVCGHPSAPGVVANGAFKGENLIELVKRFGTRLVGTRAPYEDHFPLLIKVLESHDPTSLQVHPNEHNAWMTGGEPKTEMWHILETQPGADMVVGLKLGTTEDTMKSAIRASLSGNHEPIESLLVHHAVKPGETYFVPGGLVHALGGGAKVFEVQQSSNSTYRLYDWGQVGEDGLPRTLHIQESLLSIGYDLPIIKVRNEFCCQQFCFQRSELDKPRRYVADPETFRVIYVQKGGVQIAAEGLADPLAVAPDSAALIPAGLRAALTPIQPGTEIIEVTLP